MEFAVLGWPPDGPALRLDHRRFAYAGKFVMTTTGKAVARAAGGDADAPDAVGDDGGFDAPLAAVAFNRDRTDPGALWLRYVTVREDRRGEGIGPRLCAFLAARARDRGVDRLRIAVNNPFAYEALYKAGFGYTGERTGLAELVLERPPPPGADYAAGLDAFRERDPGEPEASFLASRADGEPPERIRAPDSGG